MPVVLLTTISVSPILAGLASVVDADTPPLPITLVTCVPVEIPVPDNGAPIGGIVPVNPIKSLPEGVINAVVIVPLLPLENTLNAGVPIADPV